MRAAVAVLLAIGVPVAIVVVLIALAVSRPPRSGVKTDQAALPEAPSERSGLDRRFSFEMAPVTYRELYKKVRFTGKLDYNEPRVTYVSAPIAGRAEHLKVDSVGVQVRKGDWLADIESHELLTLESELIRALNTLETARQGSLASEVNAAQTDLENARAKLLLFGILPEQLTEIEASRKPSSRLSIHALMDGVAAEKRVRAGQHVGAGDVLYVIADLDPIWLHLDIRESDLGWVQYGQQAEVTVEAFPGETFCGTVTFISPVLDDKARTVQARATLQNPDRRLKPMMSASAVVRVHLRPDGGPQSTGMEGRYFCILHPEVVQDTPGHCPICARELEHVPGLGPLMPPRGRDAGREAEKSLAIPTTAVLDAGIRTVTYRQTASGAYELTELVLGPLAEGTDDAGQTASYFPVLAGLRDGDRVVVREGFLLDSQRQIEGKPSLLFPPGQPLVPFRAEGAGGDR